MTEIENKEILHQINNERLANRKVNQFLSLLDGANRQIAIEIKKTHGVETKKRYYELQKYIKQVAQELKDNYEQGMDVESFIENELREQNKLFSKAGVNLVLPSPKQAINSALFTPTTDYSTWTNYLDNMQNQFAELWDSQVRIGYMSGIPTKQIVKTVMGAVARDAQIADAGLMQKIKNSVMANTRTALQSFATETRKQIYDSNKKLFKGYRWLATLDRRTCLVCGKFDGEIKENYTDFENPPVHHNCRCIIIPVMRDDEYEGETRESVNGYEDANITYSDWLKNQSDDIQKQVLGATRYKMYKNGTDFDEFVNNWDIVTIKELEK